MILHAAERTVQFPASSFQLQTSSDRWLAAAALVFGLGMTHHRMIALMLPAATCFGFLDRSALIRQPRRWLVPLLCAFTPLLLYLYLPIRGQTVTSLDGTFVPTLAGTLELDHRARLQHLFDGQSVRGGAQRQLNHCAVPGSNRCPDDGGRVHGVGHSMEVQPPALCLSIAGLDQSGGVRLRLQVQNAEVFFLPAFMLTAVWAAWGLAPLFDGLALQGMHVVRRAGPRPWTRSFIVAGWVASLAVVMLFEPVRNTMAAFPEQNHRDASWGVYDYGADMISAVARGGQVIGLLGETTLVRYFRDVLGQRPDVEVIPADAEAARFAAVDAALAAARPAYLTASSARRCRPLQPGRSRPADCGVAEGNPCALSCRAAAGRGCRVGGGWNGSAPTHAGPVVRLALTWAAAQPIREELKVSARILDAAGQVTAQDDRVPVHFAYPTSAWVPSEQIVDVYDLPIAAGTSGSDFSPLLILYRAADGGGVGRVQLPPTNCYPLKPDRFLK